MGEGVKNVHFIGDVLDGCSVSWISVKDICLYCSFIWGQLNKTQVNIIIGWRLLPVSTRAYFKESYNGIESKKCWPLKISSEKMFHFPTISDDLFGDLFFNCTHPISSDLSPSVRFQFWGFHTSFPLLHFQIYNSTTTAQMPFLQLQITFYNCTNRHQLHIKICPGFNDKYSGVSCKKGSYK